MSDETASLGLPYLAEGQRQKHVTVNEALRTLDAVVQLAVADRDRTVPPVEPDEGARHIVGAGASGAWDGRDGDVAAFVDGGWMFFTPRPGWLAIDLSAGEPLHWSGAGWAPFAALQGIGRLGIGTDADGENPFAAKLNKALWTARGVSEGGDGDLRYTLNKDGAGNVLSLLFQSGYQGRAELGLIGDDDLAFKVSADGTEWTDALRIERSSGVARFPRGVEGGDLDLSLALMALRIAGLLGGPFVTGGTGNRIADGFDTTDLVDLAGSFNLDTGTAGLLKPVSGLDMTVRSLAFAAPAAPARARLVARVVLAGAVPGTDLLFEASRNDGDDWANVPMTARFTSGGVQVLEGEASLAGQPAGTAPRWQVRSLNGKAVELHDLHFAWR